VTSRDAILQAARRLFGERGYAATTIREIAAEAGVSPALVMKACGSKEQLYADATPLEPTPIDAEQPLSGLGELLVRRMLDRRGDEVAEPWLRGLYLISGAPDPAGARAEFRERMLQRFPATGADSRRRADQLACLLIGLAAGSRVVRLLDPDLTDLDAVVREYGALAQQLIDGTAAQERG
jgi:AcrR family transcriptional regulator